MFPSANRHAEIIPSSQTPKLHEAKANARDVAPPATWGGAGFGRIGGETNGKGGLA